MDNYDHVNDNNEEQHNDGTMVSGSLELEQHHLDNFDTKTVLLKFKGSRNHVPVVFFCSSFLSFT